MFNILVVEQSPTEARALQRILAQQGFRPRIVGTQSAAIDEIHRAPPALILLDIELPDAAETTSIHAIRHIYCGPVLVLNASTQKSICVAALDAGADDYIVKPYYTDELLARLRRAIISRTGPAIGLATLRNFQFNRGTRSITDLAGTSVSLTEAEMMLFGMLLDLAPSAVPRDLLSRVVLGREWTPFDRSIDVHIANLRKKLDLLQRTGITLQSIRGVGYRMNLYWECRPRDGPT